MSSGVYGNICRACSPGQNLSLKSEMLFGTTDRDGSGFGEAG